MTLTVLAVIFLLIVLAVALFGFRAIIKHGNEPRDINIERCSLCRREYNKSQMIERQVGDYRLFFFCGSCIKELHNDLTQKN